MKYRANLRIPGPKAQLLHGGSPPTSRMNSSPPRPPAPTAEGDNLRQSDRGCEGGTAVQLQCSTCHTLLMTPQHGNFCVKKSAVEWDVATAVDMPLTIPVQVQCPIWPNCPDIGLIYFSPYGEKTPTWFWVKNSQRMVKPLPQHTYTHSWMHKLVCTHVCPNTHTHIPFSV